MDNIIYIDFKNKKRIYPENNHELIDTDVGPTYPDRKDAFLRLLDCGMVRSTVDGAHPDVELPELLKGVKVFLNWSWKFAIPDLVIDDTGIRGTLSFQQTPFRVNIPWGAVLSICNAHNESESKIDWETQSG